MKAGGIGKPIPPSSVAICAIRFCIISAVMVGSSAAIRRRMAMMAAMYFWAASWPGPSLSDMKASPS